MPELKRIGVLTAGGDCPGLNAVIRGVVKSAGTHGYEVVGFLKGYEGLVDPVSYIPLNNKNTTGILGQGGTILGSTNKGRFAATVGVNDRLEIDPELIAGVKTTMEQLSIAGLICIGGDGSLAVAQQFHEQGIPVVGVPKTIDNDLSSTAFTFGFFSAVFCATDALDRLHTTAASHERVMVLEVMGRHAGWIALYAGVAGGADVILLPEIPFTYESICDKIREREGLGKKFTLVVVAEGAREKGMAFTTSAGPESNREARLGGIGAVVTAEVEKRTGKEARNCVLGHLQRGGSPTTFDRALCTMFGAHAVELIAAGELGTMVAYLGSHVGSVKISEAVGRLKTVRPEGSLARTARALGISLGD